MTIVAGIETPDGVVIGADSGCTSGQRLIARAEPKVFRIGNSLVIGSAGSARHKQILKEFFKLEVRDDPRQWLREGNQRMQEKNPEQWMLRVFIPHLRKLFEDHAWWQTHRERAELDETFMLVGVSNQLFAVWTDLQIERTLHGYHAIGSGSEVARGSLYTTRDWDDPERRIHEAVNAAIEFTASCREPWHFEASEVVK